jgi:hypothetical protein
LFWFDIFHIGKFLVAGSSGARFQISSSGACGNTDIGGKPRQLELTKKCLNLSGITASTISPAFSVPPIGQMFQVGPLAI